MYFLNLSNLLFGCIVLFLLVELCQCQAKQSKNKSSSGHSLSNQKSRISSLNFFWRKDLFPKLWSNLLSAYLGFLLKIVETTLNPSLVK